MIRSPIMDVIVGDRIKLGAFEAKIVTVRPTTIEIKWDLNSERVWINRFGTDYRVLPRKKRIKERLAG